MEIMVMYICQACFADAVTHAHTHTHIHPVIKTDGKQIGIPNETAALFGKSALSD